MPHSPGMAPIPFMYGSRRFLYWTVFGSQTSMSPTGGP